MRAPRITEFVTPAAALATARVPLPTALSPLECAAWEGMLLTRASLLEQLDRELQREQQLPLTHYDVLLKLSQSPGGQQRMSELANGVLLTKSGLTRVVDVLEKNGFLERVRSEEDGRGRYARLTPAGRAGLQSAHPVHMRGVRARFFDKLSDKQLRCLVEMWHALLSEGPSSAGVRRALTPPAAAKPDQTGEAPLTSRRRNLPHLTRPKSRYRQGGTRCHSPQPFPREPVVLIADGGRWCCWRWPISWSSWTPRSSTSRCRRSDAGFTSRWPTSHGWSTRTC